MVICRWISKLKLNRAVLQDFYAPTISMNKVIFDEDDKELVTSGVNMPNIDMLSRVAEIQCLLSYGVSALDLTVPQQATEDLQRTEATIRQFLLASGQNGNPQPG